MAVNYTTATKNARMGAVVSQIGAGGKIKLLAADNTPLAIFTLADPAGTVTNGALTFSDANGAADGILNTNAIAAGVAAKAIVTTSADADVITGLTVGTSGADFTLDNTNLAPGQAITINSATITHA